MNYSDHTCRLRSPLSRLETETAIHSDSDFATVTFLRIQRPSFDRKTEQSPDLAVPALLDYPYHRVMEGIQARIPDDDNDHLERAQTPIYPDLALGTIHRDSCDTSDMLFEGRDSCMLPSFTK